MDSVTQFVLGASVGEAVLGKKVGNKAIIWGGIAGTIPDLDVFLNPFFDEVSSLLIHRSISHSLFFPFVAAPIIGYLVSKLHTTSGNRKGWTYLFFWAILTHPILDLFTGYGTGLFTPFYDYRFQLDTIFIIDPGYTLPLLLAVTSILFLSRQSKWRSIVNWIGIGLAQTYLLFTVYHKLNFQTIVEQNLQDQAIHADKFMTAPAPLNNFLWWVLVEENNTYKVSYYSFFDSTDQLQFKSFDKNSELLNPVLNSEQTNTLIKFSKGFYSVKTDGKKLIFNDLRFGPTAGWFDLSKDFIFSFDIEPINGNIYIKRRPATFKPGQEDFVRLIDRIKGI